MYKIIMTSS